MASDPAYPPPPRNRLLASLPPADRARLWPKLERVEYKLRHLLLQPEAPITEVHFPESGWASMVVLLADGKSAEVGMVGPEGMVGLPLLLGSDVSAVESMVQSPGPMLRLGAADLAAALEDSPTLRPALLRAMLSFHQQVTQTAACNGHHALDQRLARWLLMAHDRAGSDEFPMTQEFLALMLCVHRPGVTVAARLFQQAGLIRYERGQMSITDRAGLEAAACECYGAMRRYCERVEGPAG
ncbi:Crp/Fnr family transcriptional regulator [Pseudoroseomonas cervicalis]|uniref:Crp/Fnr family transcriptional regulator n=1 Tax=Teichococcus cervicalis TaxID=204525 RepID=UPI0022F17712|nr:Crp/Fnr family transcriptional regulator [Pseudoroseomonas cervicalis]WBV44365.1 Crp/Fnr family transcriptional regulator [Pseudoroseomonas cervicalis]